MKRRLELSLVAALSAQKSSRLVRIVEIERRRYGRRGGARWAGGSRTHQQVARLGDLLELLPHHLLHVARLGGVEVGVILLRFAPEGALDHPLQGKVCGKERDEARTQTSL